LKNENEGIVKTFMKTAHEYQAMAGLYEGEEVGGRS
jgi:hypothetical protein